MENRKSSQTTFADAKFPHWIWLLALFGTVDLFVYGAMLLIDIPPADRLSTLSDTAALIAMVGGQGIGFAFLGAAIIGAAKTSLVKKRLNYKRFAVFNTAGFFLIGVIPLIIFLPEHNNSDYGFGMALLPFFVYPIFNLIRFLILFAASFLIVKSSPAA